MERTRISHERGILLKAQVIEDKTGTLALSLLPVRKDFSVLNLSVILITCRILLYLSANLHILLFKYSETFF